MKAKLTLDQRSLDDAFDQLEKELGEIARGVAVTFWYEILERTPQQWGEMAASWTFTVGEPRFVDRSDQVQHVVFLKKGNPAAIMIANENSEGNEVDFRLGQTAWITNGAGHALRVESGAVKLREYNLPGRPVAKSLGVMTSRYSRGIAAGTAIKLRQKKIEV